MSSISNNCIDLSDLKKNIEMNFCTKMNTAYVIFESSNVYNLKKEKEMFEWFLELKSVIQKNKEEFILLYKTISNCLESSHCNHMPIFKIKLDLLESVLQLLDQSNISNEIKTDEKFVNTITECFLSVLLNENFLKYFLRDTKSFTKFAGLVTQLYPHKKNLKDKENYLKFGMKRKTELMNKLLDVIKKLKWNQDFRFQEVSDMLLLLGKLYLWNDTVCKSDEIVMKHIQQSFFNVVTKDNSLCGILLTSFHDETILIKEEYFYIQHVLSYLSTCPLQETADIAGIIYSLILNVTYIISQDYFGNISFVFEKLDSILRLGLINISDVKDIIESESDLGSFELYNKSYKISKIIIAYKYLIEFLINNNISHDLPLKRRRYKMDKLIDLIENIALSFIAFHCQETLTSIKFSDVHDVFQLIFTYAPHLAVKLFKYIHKYCCLKRSKLNHYEESYGRLLCNILNIHFKMSKESSFLKIMFLEYIEVPFLENGEFDDAIKYVFPEIVCNSLFNMLSNISSERMLTIWFSYIVLGYKDNIETSYDSLIDEKDSNLPISSNFYYLKYCFRQLLISTINCILLKGTMFKTERDISDRLLELLDYIQNSLKLASKLFLKQNECSYLKLNLRLTLIEDFLSICLHIGALKLMCYKYDLLDLPNYGAPCVSNKHNLHILNNYMNEDEWNCIVSHITKWRSEKVDDLLRSLCLQSLDILYNFNDNFTGENLATTTARYLMHFKPQNVWLLKNVHLLEPHLSLQDKLELSQISNKVYNTMCITDREDEALACLKNKNWQELNSLVLGFSIFFFKSEIFPFHFFIRDAEVLSFIELEEKSFILQQISKSGNDNIYIGGAESEDETNSDENSDSDSESQSKRIKLDRFSIENSKLLKTLVTFDRETDFCVSSNKELLSSVVKALHTLPLSHLQSSSQHLLFHFIFTVSLLTLHKLNKKDKSDMLMRNDFTKLLVKFVQNEKFILNKNISLIPVLSWINNEIVDAKDRDTIIIQLCKQVVKDEIFIKQCTSYYVIFQKNSTDIDSLKKEINVIYNFTKALNEFKYNSDNLIVLKNKILKRLHKNFKMMNAPPCEPLVPLFTFMLKKSLKEHDNDSIQSLCLQLHPYLDIALKIKYIELVELALTYSDLELKSYIPNDFISKVFFSMPNCANLCFQSSNLEQFNKFLNNMKTKTILYLNMVEDESKINEFSIGNEKISEIEVENKNEKKNGTDIENLIKIFDAWRKLIGSHLSRTTNTLRATELDELLNLLSTHITLYPKMKDTSHFEYILDLVLDILNSPIYTTLNINVVFLLFNMITNHSCRFMLQCIKILQYLISKKIAIISDQIANFIQKFKLILFQLAKNVSKLEISLDDETNEYTSVLNCIKKLAHSIKKEKKYFQRIGPYILSDLIQLFEIYKFPLNMKIYFTEVTNYFISICDEHGITFLKQNLPDSSKQVFMKLHQNYITYYSKQV